MAAKKKKKVVPIIIMLAAVLVLGTVYYLLDRLDLNAEPEDESGVITVQSLSLDNITSCTFTDTEGEEITLVRENGIWYIDSDRDFPVNGEDVSDMISGMGTILATREISEDNGEYGFDDPLNKLTVVYAEDDGEIVKKYTVGITNTFNGGTYIRDDTTGKIFSSSSNFAEKFNVAKNDLIKLDVFAYNVENTSVKNVTLTGIDGTTNSITDTDGIEEFIGEPFGSIGCENWVEYGADDSDMAKYGITKSADGPGILLNFKNTQTVTDADGGSSAIRVDAEYNVWLGNTAEDGGIYYTVTDSSIVYKMSRETYDKVMAYLTYVPDESDSESLESDDGTDVAGNAGIADGTGETDVTDGISTVE